jgi:aryl-alcohol dehydrogenase-like predicted oxidoreductase
MQYRILGRTGLKVSAISLGGLFFGELAKGRDSSKTIARAAELGINLIDTAIGYKGSEEDIGKSLTDLKLRNQFILCTKWWPYQKDGKTLLQDPVLLRRAVEESLGRLRTDHLEILLFHSLTFAGDVVAVASGPLMEEVHRLKSEGKLGFVGLSNPGDYDTEDARLTEAAQSGSFDVVMPEFLLFRNRAVRNTLPIYKKCNVGVISIIPLGQAAWGYGLRDRQYLVDSLKTLREKGKLPEREPYTLESVLDFLLDQQSPTIASAALRFCLSYPEISTVCCGTNNPEHLEQNAATADSEPYSEERLARALELFGTL